MNNETRSKTWFGICSVDSGFGMDVEGLRNETRSKTLFGFCGVFEFEYRLMNVGFERVCNSLNLEDFDAFEVNLQKCFIVDGEDFARVLQREIKTQNVREKEEKCVVCGERLTV